MTDDGDEARRTREAAVDELRRSQIEQLNSRMLTVREQTARADALREKADRERRDAILAAREAGLTLTEIGKALGLTTGRVSQIITGAGRSTR